MLLAQPALAAKRVALVIGNSAYQNVVKLTNPSNDAEVMAATLKGAGFDLVELKRDLKVVELRRALRDFSDRSRDADIAVLYFAGHGIEIDGTNYIIPTDALLERDIDAFDEAIPLDRLLTVIEPAKRLRLVILDACRDNPFSKIMKRTSASRAIERGLARVEPIGANTLVAFAAKAGSTAADGDNKNSPFTAALIKYLPRPGLDLRKAFGFVRDEVLRTTNNRQEPFLYGSLGGEDLALVELAAPARDSEAEIRRAYELALQISTPDVWASFIATYPHSFYSELAKAQRRKLTEETARSGAAEEQARTAADKAAAAKAADAKAADAKAADAARAVEQARLAAEKKVREDAVRAAEAKAAEQKAAEVERARRVTEAKAQEQARLAAEQVAKARAAEEAKAAEQARLAAEKKAREEQAAKVAEAKAKAAEDARAAEQVRLAAEKRAREDAAKAAESKAAEQRAAEAERTRQLAEAKAQERTRLAAEQTAKAAEDAKAAEQARLTADKKAREDAAKAIEAKAIEAMAAEQRAAEAERARQLAEAKAQEQTRLAAEQAAKAKAAEDARAAEQARLAAEKKAREDAAKAAEARVAEAKAAEAKVAEQKAAEAERARQLAEQAKAATDDGKAGDTKAATQLAALSPDVDGAAKPAQQTASDIPRLLQGELRRVGCLKAEVTGAWNDAAQRSLQLFNKNAGTKFDVKLASLDALDAVRGRPVRVCPLICEHGFRPSGEDCVRITCGAGFELGDDNTCVRVRAKQPARREAPPVAAKPPAERPTAAEPGPSGTPGQKRSVKDVEALWAKCSNNGRTGRNNRTFNGVNACVMRGM
ncbi:caspase family protein [Bradyrhizobium sp. OK095]|uniref:caspase family protein n=1 Tax=Bradyrhizobium sp. OK095 TaxID=1882760 RepID=UPI001FCD94FF|nr:caspase family protein [Bradyrhizobium sp. OK095]